MAPITDPTSVVIATKLSTKASTVCACSSAAAAKLPVKTAAITAYLLWRRANSSDGLSGAVVIDAGRRV